MVNNHHITYFLISIKRCLIDRIVQDWITNNHYNNICDQMHLFRNNSLWINLINLLKLHNREIIFITKDIYNSNKSKENKLKPKEIDLVYWNLLNSTKQRECLHLDKDLLFQIMLHLINHQLLHQDRCLLSHNFLLLINNHHNHKLWEQQDRSPPCNNILLLINNHRNHKHLQL